MKERKKKILRIKKKKDHVGRGGTPRAWSLPHSNTRCTEQTWVGPYKSRNGNRVWKGLCRKDHIQQTHPITPFGVALTLQRCVAPRQALRCTCVAPALHLRCVAEHKKSPPSCPGGEIRHGWPVPALWGKLGRRKAQVGSPAGTFWIVRTIQAAIVKNVPRTIVLANGVNRDFFALPAQIGMVYAS